MRKEFENKPPARLRVVIEAAPGWAIGFGLMCAGMLLVQGVAADETNLPPVEVTNLQQVRARATQSPDTGYFIHLEGDILWADPANGKVVLKDDSSAEELEIDLQRQSVASGQRIVLSGYGTITRTVSGFRIGTIGPVVDNDGIHGMVAKQGMAYLEAGRNPIRVDWFNGSEGFGLEVEYSGPSMPRQKIPDAALFHVQVDDKTGASNWVNGLDFKSCAASSEILPEFERVPALKTGTVKNFDLQAVDRKEHVGLSFSGFLEISQSGFYTFHTVSDDGSQLYVGKPTLMARVVGQASFPQSRRFAIGENLPVESGGEWSEIEGTVTFFSEQSSGGAKLELRSGSSRMWAVVADGVGLSAAGLLDKNIRATGFLQGAFTSDGRKIPGTLLVRGTNDIVITGPRAKVLEIPESSSGSLPLLTTAAEVHRLKREEAQRGYPVKLRGVVTSVLPEHQAFTLQDSTRGLYIIDFSSSRTDSPKIGELMEVEGKTDPSLFAPVVYANRVSSHGAHAMPDPVRPTWDQLINGSLDAQYVEIQGVLTDLQSNGVALLTRDGLIRSDLRVNGVEGEALKRYEDALVRIRGCLFATWDGVTHKLKVGEIRILGADITVDQPAPADLYSTPSKTAAELTLFDPQASDVQRVKVSGEIIHARGSEYFMMDGPNGVRFITRRPTDLRAGDLVEVVGFPELSSASPVLREAVARKVGKAALPPPRNLDENQLVGADNDSTRVRIKATLIGQRSTPSGQSLEMRAGLRTFLSWLPMRDREVEVMPVESRLELTGTYASLGGNRAMSKDSTSFELLLNSPADIKLLARPPWWTLQRLLIILGALACVLAMTALWITQLRRKVEVRTAELEVQIRERQRVEQQHALEQERARIAQDLHDELGSGLTEIGMLGARARPAFASDEKRGRYLDQMSEKATHLVLALDEIVWAMNPKHDSVASMVSYFSLYADRFLGLANIAWRLESPFDTTDHAVDSRHRHQLFLAFKEALTNVVHHSQATEVRFSLRVHSGQIQLTIADNGRGLVDGDRTEAMDGLANMRARLEKLGGWFEMESNAGKGATVRFHLPVNN